jgi:cation transport regulator ChaC
MSETILAYLQEREGRSCHIREEGVVLENRESVTAYVPTFSGKCMRASLAERADMVSAASGTSGRCSDYVKDVAEKLAQLGIRDTNVEEFWAAVQASTR